MTNDNALVIRGGRVVCAARDVDETADVLVVDGRVHEVGARTTAMGADEIDASGKWVLPGLVDVGATLRDPGREDEETLGEFVNQALAGGITTLAPLPWTTPVVDSPQLVDVVRMRAQAIGAARFLSTVCATKAARNESLAPLFDLDSIGARLFCVSTDDTAISPRLLRTITETASSLGTPVWCGGLDRDLHRGAVASEGEVATRLGLPASPASAEVTAVQSRIEIASLTLCRLSLGFLSAARAVDLLTAARMQGVDVVGSVSLSHLLLDEGDLLRSPYDSGLRFDPPLRAADDRRRLLQAVEAGELMVGSGHRPVSPRFKDKVFEESEPGANTLSTYLSALSTLTTGEQRISLKAIVGAAARMPAQFLGEHERGHLLDGARADIVVFDPDGECQPRTGRTNNFLSGGPQPRGRVTDVLVDGMRKQIV